MIEGTEKYIINLAERKIDQRIVLVCDEDLEENPEDYNLNKQFLLEINVKKKYEMLTYIIYFLTEKRKITQSQMGQLTVACSIDDINTRKLTKDECVESLRNTHNFIHDVLKIDEFTVVQDNGEERVYKWKPSLNLFHYL